MIINIKKVAIACFLVFSTTISGCSTPQINPLVADIKNNVSAKSKNNITITGLAQFPGLRLKGAGDEIGIKATVSLIYPQDYQDVSLRGLTVITGETNSAGRFTLHAPPEFAINEGDIFTLEAIKRKDGPGNDALAIRTNLMWNGVSFDSITTPGIVINSKTTALSLISSLDSSSVSPIDTIGKMEIEDITVVKPVNSIVTVSLINSVKDLVEEALTLEQDPVASILFVNGRYFLKPPFNKLLTYGCVGSVEDCTGKQHDKILYISENSVFTMNIDGTDKRKITDLEGFYNAHWQVDFHNPVWSPDNSKILFTVGSGGEQRSYLILMNADGSGKQLITFGDSVFPNLAEFAATGSKIFITDEVFSGTIMNLDGSESTNVLQLFSGPPIQAGQGYYSKLSRDGTKIAFTQYLENKGSIYVMNTDGTNQIKVVEEEGKEAIFDDWSPDGSKIVFRYSYDLDVYTVNSDGSNQTKLTNFSTSPNQNITGKVVWSPDGRKIAFSTVENGISLIWVMNQDGSDLHTVFQSVSSSIYYLYNFTIKWSSDSSRIVFTAGGPGTDNNYYAQIFSVNADGTGLTQLTNDTNGSGYPSFTHAPPKSIKP